MKLADSLRPECMPEIIYSICKLIGSKKYKKYEIKKLITLDDSNTPEFNKAYNFAKECEFIKEDDNEVVSTYFTDEELSSFRKFRYTIFKNIFHSEPTKFNRLVKWFLSQDSSIFELKTGQDLATKISQEVFQGKEKDYALAFRFWFVSLGLGMFADKNLVFATNNVLKDWLEFDAPFKKGEVNLAKDFFNKLINDLPAFEDCIDNSEVNLALSMGLRVLHINEIIELKYVTDSGDIWHLVDSVSYPRTNNITEIIVR